ncbi:hypothetical protein NP493_691g02049 [Ridgeia piscesae]|uniref:Uncharacterized protein n=1 Tax=Ridgeia piscesae TaxID=27915 RepID=A0AAD9NQR8_RIDPI|nr:hypothetical protein NP493_691g02049 [Ridgeia piscesae]
MMVATSPVTSNKRPTPELLACVRKCEVRHMYCIDELWTVNHFMIPIECYDHTKICLDRCHHRN